jgi:hypothetical protein
MTDDEDTQPDSGHSVTKVPYVSDCRVLYANGHKVSATRCLKTT